MSWEIPSCSDCIAKEEFAGAGPFPGGSIYAVSWRCPSCQKLDLDLCPMASIVPGSSLCLNCGANRQSDLCDQCGTADSEIVARVSALEKSTDSIVESAGAMARAGLIRLALNMLDARLREFEDDAEAWLEKGRILQSMRFWSESIEPLERAAERGAAPETLIAIGCALSELGRHEDAINAYQRMIDHPGDPTWIPVALSNQANSFTELGNLDRAIALHRRAIEMDPTRTVFRMNLASVFMRKREFAEALSVLDEAPILVERDERSKFLYMRAYALCDLERGEEAIDAIDESLVGDERNPSKLYVRGWALGLVGRLDEAREALAQVLELNPNDPDATRAKALIDAEIQKQSKQPWWKIW